MSRRKAFASLAVACVFAALAAASAAFGSSAAGSRSFTGRGSRTIRVVNRSWNFIHWKSNGTFDFQLVVRRVHPQRYQGPTRYTQPNGIDGLQRDSLVLQVIAPGSVRWTITLTP